MSAASEPSRLDRSKRITRQLALCGMALLAMACSRGAAQALSAADRVAEQYLSGPQPSAPTPKLAKDLAFLNNCTAKRIRCSDIRYSDSQD